MTNSSKPTKKFLPRIDVWQDDFGKLFAYSREEYSRDIFDYQNQNGTFEYLSKTEAEAIACERERVARAKAFEESAQVLGSEYANSLIDDVPGEVRHVIKYLQKLAALYAQRTGGEEGEI